MAINKEQKAHGAAFLRLMEFLSDQLPEVKVSVRNLSSRNFYVVEATRNSFIGAGQTVSFGIVNLV